MPSKKKTFIKTLCTANAVCGCTRTKPDDVYNPKPKPKRKPEPKIPVSRNPKPKTNTEDEIDSSTSFSFNISTSPQNSDSEATSDPPRTSKAATLNSSSPKIDGSFAVVKDSEDPYQDFRQSMLQMITENEIYSKNELRELLRCFLDLNSPHQHDVIVQVFTEIWGEVMSETLVVQKPSPISARPWSLARVEGN